MTTLTNAPEQSQLGRTSAYPDRYDPSLLFPMPRAAQRNAMGIDEARLPFDLGGGRLDVSRPMDLPVVPPASRTRP